MATRQRKVKTKQRRPSAQKTRKSMPLAAVRNTSRKTDVERASRAAGRDHRSSDLFSANHELAGLMNRRTKALLELPLRLSGCTSPIQVWSEQTRFLQDYLGDCYAVAVRMVEASTTGRRPRK